KIMTLLKINPNRNREFFPSSFQNMFDSMLDESYVKRNSFRPQTDIYESENSFFLELSLPGMKKEDIKIDLQTDMLVVSGERKPTEKEGLQLRKRESSFGEFSLSFNLPKTVKYENVS